MLSQFIVALQLFRILSAYQTNPTPWGCIEYDTEFSPSLPSCLPGYIIHMENVIFESSDDDSCSGIARCRLEKVDVLNFSCNGKRTCQVDVNHFRFRMNSTCGVARRFFAKYRCLPVIQEQKDYLCDSPSTRRATLADINLSCPRNYHIRINTAVIGISLKPQDDQTKARFKCNKDTQSMCNSYATDTYRDVCNRQLKSGYEDQCKIRHSDRAMLKDCPYGLVSNYSMVEYQCVPGEGVTEDLDRIDICSSEPAELISSNRGVIYSPSDPQALGTPRSCQKRLAIHRASRVRLVLLGKSIDYAQELTIRLSNNLRTLPIDVNTTDEESIQIDLETNSLRLGQVLLYFQVDPWGITSLNHRQQADGDTQYGKAFLRNNWLVLVGCFIGLVVLIAIILVLIRISKRRRARALRYLKSNDDHRQHLNASIDHHDKNAHLLSSSPVILPLASGNQQRPHSASSTTSSIIVHQVNDGMSDRESLIKPPASQSTRANADIDNFYEEIKEQQQQTALALSMNSNKGDSLNPYLEAKYIEERKPLFQGHPSTQAIRDHNEQELHYQHPTSSIIEESSGVRTKAAAPKIPPRRQDLPEPKPSAPPLHLTGQD